MRFFVVPAFLILLIIASIASCGSNSTTAGTGGSSGSSSTSGGGSTAACIPGLTSIVLTPADSKVTLDGKSAAPIPFSAEGTFAAGNKALDPGKLSWSVTRADATLAGTIAAGVLTPNPYAGGVVTVTATDGCITGTTTVTFFLNATQGDCGVNCGDWTGNPVTGVPAPTIVYPSDQTRIPRNLYRTLFQWRSGGFTDFRLTFEGPNSKVTVYTNGVHGLCAMKNPPAGCWEVNEVDWSLIAGSNAGSTAKWVVDALDKTTTPPTVRRSASIEIGFSLQDVEGAIFYWSTTNAGIRRGRISQQDPENYVAGKNPQTIYPVNNAVKCVACHVVSRSGKYMAAPTAAATSGLWIYEVTQNAPPNPLVTDIANTGGHGFATIAPDDVNVVAAWGGKMWMVDRATGAYKTDLALAPLQGTQPDWSPLGGEVVFATGSGDGPGNASLARIPFQNGTWGKPSIFLPPPVGKSLNFPMFSHDAEWIAYSVGKGGHNDSTAQLWIVDSPGAQPVELVNANRVVSNAMTTGQHENQAPTWAPKGDYYWVAFNSERAYGVVRPGGNNQIWVAAVRPDKGKPAIDPSFPAFRVPFQGLDEANHRAFWTLDIGNPGGNNPDAGAPPPCSKILTLGEVCDPVNDCCESGAYCETLDSGMTYTCLKVVPK